MKLLDPREVLSKERKYIPPEQQTGLKIMKLLDKQESSAVVARVRDTDRTRSIRLQEEIAKKYRELEEAERFFNETLQQHREIWKDEESKHLDKVQEIRDEVDALEARKREALIPLTERKRILDTRDSALDEREASLDARSVDLERGAESLQQRIDEVSEREIRATEVSEALSRQKLGIDLQRQEMQQHSGQMSIALSDAAKQLEATRKQAADILAAAESKAKSIEMREMRVSQREIDVEAKEVLYKNYPFTSPIHEQHSKIRGSSLDTVDSVGGDRNRS